MLLPGEWGRQRCYRRRSHERVWRTDPAGDVRSACFGCRLDVLPQVAYHLHVGENGIARRVCFNAYGQCPEGTESAAWLHPARVSDPSIS
jgi:hypothetical protein